MKLNNKGLTLVEVLAVLVISTIVLVTLLSILSSSTSTNVKQTKDTQQLFDLSYSLKIITKDVRKSKSFEQMNDDFVFTPAITENSTTIIYTFDKATNTIFRDTVPVAKNIACFYITTGNGDPANCSPGDDVVPIEISTLTKINIYIRSLNKNVVETELFLRKGDDI